MCRLDAQLQQEQWAQHNTQSGAALLNKRAQLPAYVRRADVLAAVQQHQVLLISGIILLVWFGANGMIAWEWESLELSNGCGPATRPAA